MAQFSDSFDRSDRALDGDNGWSWAVGSAGFDIVSNELQVGSTPGDNSQVNSGLSLADGLVQCDIKIAGATSVGLVFRYQDPNNFYLVDVGFDGTGAIFFFYKRQGGSYVLIDSLSGGGPAWATNTWATVKVEFEGSAVAVSFNGSLADTFADGTFTGAGLTGLRNGSGATGARVADNFLVDDLVVAPSGKQSVKRTGTVPFLGGSGRQRSF